MITAIIIAINFLAGLGLYNKNASKTQFVVSFTTVMGSVIAFTFFGDATSVFIGYSLIILMHVVISFTLKPELMILYSVNEWNKQFNGGQTLADLMFEYNLQCSSDDGHYSGHGSRTELWVSFLNSIDSETYNKSDLNYIKLDNVSFIDALRLIVKECNLKYVNTVIVTTIVFSPLNAIYVVGKMLFLKRKLKGIIK